MRVALRTAGVSAALMLAAAVGACSEPGGMLKRRSADREGLTEDAKKPISPGIGSQWTGVPFRAVQVIVRRGPGGVVETRGRVARSSDGSTYVELIDENTKQPVEALIFDVPHHREMVLDVASRRYRVQEMPGLEGREAPAEFGTEQLRIATAQKDIRVHEVKDGVELTWKRLGVRRIAGLEAVGNVEVRRPLAGTGEATDGPAEVDESWVSVDLGIAVLRTRHDPLTGADTEVSLTEVVRAEPDGALFAVPAGYALESGDARLVRSGGERARAGAR